MTAWINGRLQRLDEPAVSANDHGLTVGDGVFETLKVVDGVPFALTRHLLRLEASAAGLGLTAPPQGRVREAVAEILAADPAAGRLRITVTGGPAPMGSDRGGADPTLLLTTGPTTVWPPTAVLHTVPWPRNERSAVAGLKTTSYAENVVALAFAHRAGADEALFLDTTGRLSEGTGSNVFVVSGGRVLTPATTAGCLAGITRDLVIEWFGATETDLGPADLRAADEVFITSSTRDVQAVRAVDGQPYAAPGPVTAGLVAQFAARATATPDPPPRP